MIDVTDWNPALIRSARKLLVEEVIKKIPFTLAKDPDIHVQAWYETPKPDYEG